LSETVTRNRRDKVGGVADVNQDPQVFQAAWSNCLLRSIECAKYTFRAALTGNREHVYQAAMLNPHPAAELVPEQICRLVDDMLEAHGEMIPEMG
jgi:alpha-galactosidase/6-phospho-beta-glucosidase family protein